MILYIRLDGSSLLAVLEALASFNQPSILHDLFVQTQPVLPCPALQ